MGLEEHMMSAIKNRFEEIAKQECDKAIAAIESRIRDETDLIALNMMKHYDINMIGEHITITVKKEL